MTNKTIEFYINNKLYKTCSYRSWDRVDEEIKNIFNNKGYVKVWNDSFLNKISCNEEVYINPLEHKCFIFAYKINTGFVDKKGNKLYKGDTVITNYSFISKIYEHHGKKGYYVTDEREFGWYYDVDLEKCEKINDVNNIPSEKWKDCETITTKEL